MSSITMLKPEAEAAPAAVISTIDEMPAPATPSMPSFEYVLKQTGGRPMTFKGQEMCTSTSQTIGTSLWYEINLYKKDEGGFVVEIKMFSKSEANKDTFRVYEAFSMDDVARVIETYDPSLDVNADLKINDYQSPSRFALQAASLKLRVDEANVQYHDLAGEMLYELCD